MKCFLLLFLFLVPGASGINAQTKSPDQFLGYALGSKFTAHDEVIDYFKYIGKQTPNVGVISYGKTYEGRELLIAVVSSKQNIDNIEQVKENSLKLSMAQPLDIKAEKQPVILWLSYNVHGNEASSTETAMKMLFVLATAKDNKIQEWLKNTVVIIDPCLNPDGRERYINYFKTVSGHKPNADPMAREHSEPWPGGRSNHYYFDLNRDWAWQTQIETQQRLKLYHEWMPQVHVDFHEQSYNEPYYFAPAAEPVHQDISAWQREFQVIAGRNNAKYFDEKGWQYFTKERFDLLYPSYGDTYPLYNGAIGMTYEQGGIGAGLAVVTNNGDTLTLNDRIDHHYTTGMATLEIVSGYAGKLLQEFKLYFERSVETPPGIYKTYVVKAQNLNKIKRLAELLKKNGIEYRFGSDKNMRGYNYETKKTEGFKVERNDLIVNLQQPKAVLANVLFEPQTVVNDPNTYDITAWALPYAYGLKAYASKESVKGDYSSLKEIAGPVNIIEKPYAWIFPWNSLEDARVLIALQNAGIKVRVAEEGFSIGEQAFPPGSLLVYRAENERQVKNLHAKIRHIPELQNAAVYTTASGYVDKGKDLGSSVYPVLSTPRIAIIGGRGISAEGAGEAWHFFEQELNYPVTMLDVNNIGRLDINKVNVLILPDGSYRQGFYEQLQDWVTNGGKLILFEGAISGVLGKKPFNIKVKEYLDNKPGVNSYKEEESIDLSDAIPGAIFKVDLDHNDPFTSGLGDYYYALKTDDKIYEPLSKKSIGILKSGSYMSGVAGNTVLRKLDSGMLFGSQALGKGTVVYFGSDVLFRSFWENGKQMFINAVFLVR